MSYSIIIGILLTLSIMTFILHFHETFSIFCIVVFGIALTYDLCLNEFLPRLFPNSFITVNIRYVDNERQNYTGVKQ